MDELYDEIDMMDSHQEKAHRLGKVLLIAGGVAVVTYIVISGLSKKKKRKKAQDEQQAKEVVVKQAEESELFKSIKEHITTFLLGLAKQKLNDLMRVLKTPRSEDVKK